MLNRFLTGHGFITVAERTIGFFLLGIIAALIAMLISLLLVFAYFFPIAASVMFIILALPIIYFNEVGVVCPLCDEKIQQSDMYEMDEGYCHEWCANMLEQREENP